MQTSNSSSTADPAKEKVKLRFARIMKLLTEGCGREYCFCKLCKNHPQSKELTKNSAASIAILNTQTETPLCEDRIIPPSLQAKEIDLLTSEISDNASYLSLLYKRTTEVFGSYESLNISFLANSDFKVIFTQKSPRLDFGSLKKFFDLITNISKDQAPADDSLKSILNKSIKNVIDTYNAELKENRIVEIGQLRFLLILLEIPQIFDYDFNAAFLGILKICLNLPPSLMPGFINWFATYERAPFARIVESFQNMISIQIITHPEERAYLKNLIEFTKILFEANKISQLLSVEEFYVETIGQEENPKEEYIIWLENKLHQKNDFTYIDYPWVLDCAYKADILDIESRYEMKKEVDNDYRKIMFQGNTGLGIPSLEQILALQNIIIKLEVRRSHLLEDTLRALQKTNVNFKKPFKVKFAGEQGVDEGGVKKEFFLLITRQLFVPDYGMFVAKENDRYVWFNINSMEPPVTFELAGMLLGLAIYNGINLDIKFPLVLYKKLLDEKLTIKDLKEFESDLYKGLTHILEYEGDLENTLCLQFTVSYDCYGEQIVQELKEGGANINVTQENKEEYVRLYIDWYFNKSIESKFRPFHKGFNKVVTGNAIRIFTGEELQTLICGSQHLNFEELEKATTYENGYSKDSPTIKYFWEVVHSFNHEQQRLFLQFCTGSDRAPIRGLGDMTFIIAKHGPDSDRLPSAHTCFNHVLLPEYSTKEKLQEKLLKAISNAEGFGLF